LRIIFIDNKFQSLREASRGGKDGDQAGKIDREKVVKLSRVI